VRDPTLASRRGRSSRRISIESLAASSKHVDPFASTAWPRPDLSSSPVSLPPLSGASLGLESMSAMALMQPPASCLPGAGDVLSDSAGEDRMRRSSMESGTGSVARMSNGGEMSPLLMLQSRQSATQRVLQAKRSLQSKSEASMRQEMADTQRAKAEGEQFRCKLPRSASRGEKLQWLAWLGGEMVRAGLVSVPVVAWDWEGSEEENAALRAVGFLFEAYKVRYWWYELTEMCRKFVLTGLLLFVFPGSLQQLAVAIVVTLGALLLLAVTTPYMDPLVRDLQFLSLLTQTLALFYGLMQEAAKMQEEVKGDVVDGAGGDSLQWVLVGLHLLTALLPLVALLHETCRSWIGEGFCLSSSHAAAPAPCNDEHQGGQDERETEPRQGTPPLSTATEISLSPATPLKTNVEALASPMALGSHRRGLPSSFGVQALTSPTSSRRGLPSLLPKEPVGCGPGGGSSTIADNGTQGSELNPGPAGFPPDDHDAWAGITPSCPAALVLQLHELQTERPDDATIEGVLSPVPLA